MSDQKITTLDQKRAKLAWKYVQEASNPKDFSIVCKQTSARILTSGLGPAVAFSQTRYTHTRGEEHRLLTQALAEHFDKKKGEELLNDLINSSADELRRHTEEAMAFLTWLARLAEGRHKQEGGDNNGG